jgi:hypothetical protein
LLRIRKTDPTVEIDPNTREDGLVFVSLGYDALRDFLVRWMKEYHRAFFTVHRLPEDLVSSEDGAMFSKFRRVSSDEIAATSYSFRRVIGSWWGRQ